MPEQQKRELTLEQFKTLSRPAEWDKVFKRIEGGTFTQCHARVFKETGIWIEELTPIFLKLDAIAPGR
jgi:hypothetical protein